MGNLHYEKGNVDLAIRRVGQGHQDQARLLAGPQQSGQCLLPALLFDEALNQWQKTVQFRDDYWPAHWNLANTYYYHRAQVDEAIAEWHRVTQINPNHWQAYYNLGEAYLEEGKIELSILEWDKVVQINPKFWHVYHNLGTLFYQRGKIDQAIAYWTRSIALMLFPW